MCLASRALLDADLLLAQRILDADAALDYERDACEEHAHALLAWQTPVTRDLRAVLAAVYCADKIERMGALAAHIARIVRSSHPQRPVPPDLESVFTELGAVAAGMADQVAGLITGPVVGGFAELEAADQRVDTLHTQVLSVITKDDWPYGAFEASALALLARFHERFAEQVISVAQVVRVASG
jgi:phosphate transport system protein